MRQRPANAGYAMCKAAHSLPRGATGPTSLPVPMFSALVQQISNLRSHADVTLISCLAGECQQDNNRAGAARKQVMDLVRRRCFGNLGRQFLGALQTIAAIQPPTRQQKISPDLRANSKICARGIGPEL